MEMMGELRMPLGGTPVSSERIYGCVIRPAEAFTVSIVSRLETRRAKG